MRGSHFQLIFFYNLITFCLFQKRHIDFPSKQFILKFQDIFMTLNLIKKLNISKAQNRSQIVNYSRSINGIYTFFAKFYFKKMLRKRTGN